MKERVRVIIGSIIVLLVLGWVPRSDIPKETKTTADISFPAIAVRASSSGETLKKMAVLKNAITPPKPTAKVEPSATTWPEPEEVWEPEYIYLGTYQVTAYEWTGNPCANGNYPTEGYTIACNSLPLGTTVYLEGIGYRTVEDRGATWHSSNWIDLYLGDVAACYAWGVQAIDVYIVD